MIKQSDMAMLVLVISVSLVVSFFVGDALINTPQNRSSEVEVVTPISSEFPAPSIDIFNEDAINPTEVIEIGNSNQEQPFGNSQN
jgi:hypothetical protein